MKKIVLFYHAYLCNMWFDIFDSHLDAILESGLYDAMQEMKIGIVWAERPQLRLIEDLIDRYQKLTTFHCRHFDSDIPFDINHTVKKYNQEFQIQLGESETILKIPEFARRDPDDAN